MKKIKTLPLAALLGLLAAALFVASPAAAGPSPGTAKAAPREITPREAVELALKRNLGLAYDRLAPELSRTNEALARSVTEARFLTDVSASGNVDRLTLRADGLPLSVDTTVDAGVGLRKAFFSGTSLEARLGAVLGVDHAGADTDVTAVGTLSLTVRQALLRGADSRVNRVEVTTAGLARTAAEHELRRKAEAVAAEVLRAYWDLYAAQANLRIQQVALELARKTLEETKQLIGLQRLAASETVSAELQVKTQERAVLLAGQTLQNLRDKLARLTGLASPRSLETPAFVVQSAPVLARPTDLAALQRLALESRGDLLAAKVAERTRQEQARAARDLLLPKLDLVGSVGVNGGRRPSADPTRTDPTLSAKATWTVGLVLEVPLGNGEAKAREELAALALRRARVAVEKQEQAISEELKVAWRAVASAEQLVALTTQAVKVAETKLGNELQRYRAGKTTAQLLTLVQADLIREQQSHEQAVAGFRQALVDVWTAAGNLLARVGAKA